MKNISKEIIDQIEIVRKSYAGVGWDDYYSKWDVEKLIDLVLKEFDAGKTGKKVR